MFPFLAGASERYSWKASVALGMSCKSIGLVTDHEFESTHLAYNGF